MASTRTLDSVWRFDDPSFSFQDKDDPSLTVTLVSTWLKFSDESYGVTYCTPEFEAQVMQQLQNLEGDECEWVLEENGTTKKGAPKWKVKGWVGKKGHENLKVLSEGSDKDFAGEPFSSGEQAGDGVNVESTNGETSSASPEANTPRDPSALAADSDWAYARDVFKCGVDAPILVALTFLDWAQDSPPSRENVTLGELDALVEKRLSGEI